MVNQMGGSDGQNQSESVKMARYGRPARLPARQLHPDDDEDSKLR